MNLFTCSTWETIDTAPKYTPILTDQGLCRYVQEKHSNSCSRDGYYLCSQDGDIPSGAIFGYDISYLAIQPRIWTHFNPPECS